jgi:pyruvate carboxylase
VRILNAVKELPMPVETYALYTSGDRTHCDLGNPDHAIEIPSASSYLDSAFIIRLIKEHSIDAIHPGYGFLSESADFVRRVREETESFVIGPGWEILARTGDKLRAKELALECGVPVLEAMDQATSRLDEAEAFSRRVGLPVMVKAVDGGGGRGIRLVRDERELESCVQLALRESPSNKVFLEKAAIDGFHHVEIQIIGDGQGQVRHLWERDCSVQRRFQKVVEFAPSLIHDRRLVSQVIESALKMARHVHYESLGTFEFLVNEQQQAFFFLEINPRLQVEHTITESLSGVDLVRTQLLLAQGYTLNELDSDMPIEAHLPSPRLFSIQLRLCAENPNRDFSLSVGKVTSLRIPSGHGTRVDTHVDMSASTPLVVGSDYDNLLAKIIVSGATWEAATQKARRVLAESHIEGIDTNLGLLRGILAHHDFMAGKIDTQWLGLNLATILQQEQGLPKKRRPVSTPQPERDITPSSTLFRKGDAWSISLEPVSQGQKNQAE